MLLKPDQATPHAGDLQLAVDKLEHLFARPVLGLTAAVATARTERREATAALDEIRIEVAEVTRRYTPDRFGNVPNEAKPALAKLKAAEDRVARARKTQHDLKEREEAALQTYLMQKASEAAPTLLEVITLMHDAFNPVFDLALASHGRLGSPPRLYSEVIRMHESMRGVTAVLNHMVTPKEDN